MLGGLAGAVSEYILYRVGVLHFASPMASNIWTAIWGLFAGVITLTICSFITKPPDPDSLRGLVFDSGSMRQTRAIGTAWYRTPLAYAVVVLVLFSALNYLFY